LEKEKIPKIKLLGRYSKKEDEIIDIDDIDATKKLNFNTKKRKNNEIKIFLKKIKIENDKTLKIKNDSIFKLNNEIIRFKNEIEKKNKIINSQSNILSSFTKIVEVKLKKLKILKN
jgi:hypothetical protein